VSEVEVDEVLRFVCDKTAKVPSYYTVPCGALFRVEFSFDVLGDILFNAELFHCFLCDFNGFLLHVLAHVYRLDLGL